MNLKKKVKRGCREMEIEYAKTFGEWYFRHEKVLQRLYDELYHICEKNELHLIRGQESFNKFVEMMYNESNKELIYEYIEEEEENKN